MLDSYTIKSKLIRLRDYIGGAFTKGHSRSISTKKSIVASVLIKGVSILISLVLVPLTIDYVNPTKYGIWLALSSIIGWFSFFDIGFGNGLRNKFGESVAQGDHEKAKTYVSTTYAVLFIIIVFVSLAFFCINPFLNWANLLNTPAEFASELSLLALIIFVFFCLQFELQLLTTVLTANQQPGTSSLLTLIGNLLSLIAIFILTKTTSGSLIYLGLAVSAGPAIVLVIASLWYYTHDYKRYAPSLKFVKFSYARDLMALGSNFFLLQLAGIVLYQTNNMIIARLFGPAEVTPYNIAFKYFGIVTMALSTVMIPFWSAYTEAWIKKDFSWINNSLKKLRLFWAITSGLAIIMVVFSNFFYRFWVGSEITVPTSVSIVMAIYVIVNGWNSVYTVFLNGTGKVKLQLYGALVGMVLNIPLSIFLGKTFGIAGVLLSTVILCGINVILDPIQTRKLLNNTAKGIWNK